MVKTSKFAILVLKFGWAFLETRMTKMTKKRAYTNLFFKFFGERDS